MCRRSDVSDIWGNTDACRAWFVRSHKNLLRNILVEDTETLYALYYNRFRSNPSLPSLVHSLEICVRLPSESLPGSVEATCALLMTQLPNLRRWGFGGWSASPRHRRMVAFHRAVLTSLGTYSLVEDRLTLNNLSFGSPTELQHVLNALTNLDRVECAHVHFRSKTQTLGSAYLRRSKPIRIFVVRHIL